MHINQLFNSHRVNYFSKNKQLFKSIFFIFFCLLSPILQAQITDIIVDDEFAEFSEHWELEDRGDQYGTNVHSISRLGVKEAIWTLPIESKGHYQVYVYSPGGTDLSPNVDYTIYHSAGHDTVSIDQRTPINQWQFLGTYYFDENQNNYTVALKGSLFSSSKHIADAVKLGFFAIFRW